MSTLVDVDDEKGLEWLTWTVYDGMLLPWDPLELEGQHDWVWIIMVTYHLMFRGDSNFDHCSPYTATSFDATQIARRHLQEPCHHLEHPGPLLCNLQSTCCLEQPLLLQLWGCGCLLRPPWQGGGRWTLPSSMPTESSLGVPERKEKYSHIRWCIVHPPRAVNLTPCGEPPHG